MKYLNKCHRLKDKVLVVWIILIHRQHSLSYVLLVLLASVDLILLQYTKTNCMLWKALIPQQFLFPFSCKHLHYENELSDNGQDFHMVLFIHNPHYILYYEPLLKHYFTVFFIFILKVNLHYYSVHIIINIYINENKQSAYLV